MQFQYGKKIAALRKSESMTQADLGKKLNVTFQAVSKWERDESIPDFETLSKIARLFNVPISYFEEEEESEEGEESQEDEEEESEEEESEEEEEEEQPPVMLGVCKQCGKVVYEGQEAETEPAILCKACRERIRQQKAAAQKAEQERIAREQREAEQRRQATIAGRIRYRNRGLIWGAVITAPIIIGLLIGMILHPEFAGGFAIAVAFFILCGYPFFAQLFWDGLIREMALFGGKIVGMPGVIFSLDLDGIFFLIAVKILFAIIKMLIFILTLLLGLFIAMIVAPFAFFPQMIKCSRGGMDDQ